MNTRRLLRHIAADYLLQAVVAFASLLIFFSIFELAEFARQVSIAQKDFGLALEMTGWNLIVISAEVAPLSMLVAVVLVGAGMARRGEIVAVQSAGISPFVLCLPVVVVASVLAAGLFLLTDRLMPQAVTRLDAITLNELGRWSSSQRYFHRQRQWFKVGKQFVHVAAIEPASQTYFGFSVIELEGGHVKRKVSAERAVSVGQEIIGYDVAVANFRDPQRDGARGNEGAELELESLPQLIMPLERGFNAFLDLSSRPQKMSLGQLHDTFRQRRRLGYNARFYESEFYGRILLPFLVVALVGVGMTYAFRVDVKRSVVRALVELLIITLLAFVIRQTFRSLAQGYLISAQFGAIGPTLILFCWAAYRLLKSTGVPLPWFWRRKVQS